MRGLGAPSAWAAPGGVGRLLVAERASCCGRWAVGVAVTVRCLAIAAIGAVLVMLVDCSRPGSHAAGDGPQVFPGAGGYERWWPMPSVSVPSMMPLPSAQMAQSAIWAVSMVTAGPSRTPGVSSRPVSRTTACPASSQDSTLAHRSSPMSAVSRRTMSSPPEGKSPRRNRDRASGRVFAALPMASTRAPNSGM